MHPPVVHACVLNASEVAVLRDSAEKLTCAFVRCAASCCHKLVQC